MPTLDAPARRAILSRQEDYDMARRRGQRDGYLYKKGPSWILEWREYLRGPDKKLIPVRKSAVVAPCRGRDALSEREVRRQVVGPLLEQIDRQATRPGSLMTVGEFWERHFEAQHLWKLKAAGQIHYRTQWHRLQPLIGHRRLCDVTPEDVEAVVREFHGRGYSGQTVLHVRNAISAMFRLARRLRLYGEENPAAGVETPEVRHERLPSLTWDQARRVLAALRSPYREMAWLSIETSMNAAELCGLRRKWLCSGPSIVMADGEVMAPYSVAVRENFYAGQYGSLKAGRRRRNLPITRELAEALAVLMRAGEHREPEDPVFQARTGRPVDVHNVSNRVFRPLSVRLGFPVTWHGFRRAHSSFVGQLQGVPVEDRVRSMGHADAAMSLHYSVDDIERRRRIPEEIHGRLLGEPQGSIQ